MSALIIHNHHLEHASYILRDINLYDIISININRCSIYFMLYIFLLIVQFYAIILHFNFLVLSKLFLSFLLNYYFIYQINKRIINNIN